MLDGFVASILQSFENCRAGLSDEAAREGGSRAEAFFRDLYERERERLGPAAAAQAHLAPAARAELQARVDALARNVLLPAYTRLACAHTVGERKGFYAAPPSLRELERLGFALLGLVLGALAVYAPFIPVASPLWMIASTVGGFAFPNIRGALARRRYREAIAGLQADADREILRLDADLSLRPGAQAAEDVSAAVAEQTRSRVR
jgi:hypothetical protein